MTNLAMPSRHRLKPLAALQPDGKIAVYIGSAYQYLDVAQAIRLRNEVNRVIDDALNQSRRATS